MNLLMNGNIIGRAEQSKEIQEESTELERLELIKSVVAIDNRGKVTVDDYIEEAIKQGITTEDEVEDNGDGSKNIITDNGWNVNIAPDPDNENNVIITIEGKGNELPPRISKLTVTEKDDTTATITIEVKRAEGATYKYYCKAEGEEYGEPFYIGTDLSKDKTELELNNKGYTIKVEATNQYGTIYKEATTGVTIKHINTATGLKAVNTKDIYGAEVKGYDCKHNTEWQIFYIDEENNHRVYLITKDYMAPPTNDSVTFIKGSTTYPKAYKFAGSASDLTVLQNYGGKATEMGSGELFDGFVKKWVYDYDNDDPASLRLGLRASNLMLNQEVWSEYLGEMADLAFGGPAWGMFTSSLADRCGGTTNVYDIWRDYFQWEGSGSAKGVWLLAPFGGQTVYFFNGERVSGQAGVYQDYGFRPVVQLKESIQFERNPDGTYTVK